MKPNLDGTTGGRGDKPNIGARLNIVALRMDRFSAYGFDLSMEPGGFGAAPYATGPRGQVLSLWFRSVRF